MNSLRLGGVTEWSTVTPHNSSRLNLKLYLCDSHKWLHCERSSPRLAWLWENARNLHRKNKSIHVNAHTQAHIHTPGFHLTTLGLDDLKIGLFKDTTSQGFALILILIMKSLNGRPPTVLLTSKLSERLCHQSPSYVSAFSKAWGQR